MNINNEGSVRRADSSGRNQKMDKIPFFRNTFGKEEKQAISDCIDSGWVVQGKKTQEFEEAFADYVGARFAVFVDSGTSALFLALQWKKNWTHPQTKPDPYLEDVRVPSLTFTSSAEVIVNSGAEPIFHDVDKETFCIDKWNLGHWPQQSIVVHLTGNRAKADSGIYDSAHRIEKDDVKGSSALWCYSFYATKNMSTVQGGMIATNDEDAYKWLKAARDHGISKGTLERYTEKVPTYSIDFVGWRVKGDDFRAVIGLEQLKKLPWMTQRRNEIVARYNRLLGYNRTGNHLYPILVSDRKKFFEAMELAEIQCSVHFLPLHKMPAYAKWGNVSLPNTEYLGERLVSIPLFPDMTDEQVDYVAEKVLETGLLCDMQ